MKNFMLVCLVLLFSTASFSEVFNISPGNYLQLGNDLVVCEGQADAPVPQKDWVCVCKYWAFGNLIGTGRTMMAPAYLPKAMAEQNVTDQCAPGGPTGRSPGQATCKQP